MAREIFGPENLIRRSSSSLPHSFFKQTSGKSMFAQMQLERNMKKENHTAKEPAAIKQESRLSLSLDRGSISLVRQQGLFRDQYHRTGITSLNVTVRHPALRVVLVARPTFECVCGSARHIKPRRYRERTPQTAFNILNKFCNKAS